MAEPSDSQFSSEAESKLLRKTLEQLRQEAETEIERLRALLSEQPPISQDQISTVTEQLALKQEMAVMQKALEAKEQALDQITAECRRLEDVLEDRNLTLERLQKELAQRDNALRDQRAELEQLAQETAKQASTSTTVIYETRSPGWLKVTTGALVLLLALSGAANVYLLRLPDSGSQANPLPVPVLTQPPIADSGPAPVNIPQVPANPRVRIHRDRLSDGTPGPTLILLDGGSFQMGAISTSGEDFSPPRLVTVGPLMIGAYEITFIEYDRFAKATGRTLPPDPGWGRERHPVVGVSWEEARDYAAWLAQQTGRRYRLPSEAEWEYAARAGTTTPFWWGMEPGVNRAACFDCGSPWDNRSTAPVITFAANPFGLYETHGNAMEWVEDCYQPNYRDAPSDGSPMRGGDCSRRVARGGAFNKPAASMRSFARAAYPPDTRLNMIGFRVACEP